MSEQTHVLPDQTMEIPISQLEEAQHQIQKRKRMKLKIIISGSVLVAVAGAVLFQIMQAQNGEAGLTPADNEPSNSRVFGSRNDQSLAKVNDTLIRWQDVANECMERYGREILEQIINRTIIQQACDKNGITVTGTEIDREILRIAKRFNLDPQAWYRVMQDERGLTELQYRRDVIWPMLALRKVAGKTIQKPTRNDIEKSFIREYGVRVEAKMIMLDNLRRAEQVYKMAKKNPKEFGRLAQKYSIEPTSKAMAGNIPPIRRFGGNKTIEQAAFKLRKGEVSAVIMLGSRYIILKCEGRTKPLVTDIGEVENELYEMVNEQNMQEGVAKVFIELKENVRIDNYMTNSSYGIRNANSKRKTSGNRVRPASATKSRNAPSYPQSASRRK